MSTAQRCLIPGHAEYRQLAPGGEPGLLTPSAGAALDYLSPELDRFALQLERVGARLADIVDRLAVGVDPQRACPNPTEIDPLRHSG